MLIGRLLYSKTGYPTQRRFTNLLFVPEVDANLVLSIEQLTSSSCAITFNKFEVNAANVISEGIIKGIKNEEILCEFTDYKGSRGA